MAIIFISLGTKLAGLLLAPTKAAMSLTDEFVRLSGSAP